MLRKIAIKSIIPNHMYILTGKNQHYAWGGTRFIPTLLAISDPADKPYAEYWLGTHPGGPSNVNLGENAVTTLPDLIRSEPGRYLGNEVQQTFGELPYLLKILDVKGMLSIQVHPTREEARKGFDHENAMGIPLDAPNRNYKDANHKPEVMVALSDFWLLHGFNPRLDEILTDSQVLHPLLPVLRTEGLSGLYQHVMLMPQEQVDLMLRPLAERIVPQYENGELSRSSPDFWAARVMSDCKPDFTGLDRGIFSIYFFNVLHLQPGQAIFQGAGIPHAYLEGQNVELMSNSDNVLRAGLTPKHVDIPELMKHTRFEYVHPQIMDGIGKGNLRNYPCPVPDFGIDMLSLRQGQEYSHESKGPEIWLQTSGRLQWRGTHELNTRSGGAVFLIPGETATLHADEDSTIFRAFVP